jgi:hypothetical protein
VSANCSCASTNRPEKALVFAGVLYVTQRQFMAVASCESGMGWTLALWFFFSDVRKLSGTLNMDYKEQRKDSAVRATHPVRTSSLTFAFLRLS